MSKKLNEWEIEDDEMVCPQCNGEILKRFESPAYPNHYIVCSLCNGYGKFIKAEFEERMINKYSHTTQPPPSDTCRFCGK